MKRQFRRDFYDVQSQQWKKSLFLFSILILFYFLALGFILVVSVLSLGFFLNASTLFSRNFLIKLLIANSILSTGIAFFHFFDAKKFGAKFIIKRLDTQPLDLSDRYHKQFANTVEEIRIASGLPKVTAYIIPSSAINSMALIQTDNTPSVLVTEGLLAESTRDEIQAVIAHELGHIIRGDSFYLTLVCSLANLFERIRQALEPETPQQGSQYHAEEGRIGHLLIYIAATFSAIIMHLLSTLVSREREILADAAAVELCRNPGALARAIYKAHLKNSFVGDFNLTYSPLFIVPPESRGESQRFFARLFNSHPPLMKRIKILANMIPTTPARIISEVWDIQKNREKARRIQPSHEELVKTETSPSISEDVPEENGKVWIIRDPKGNEQGPFSLEELLFLQFFSPLRWVKNVQEGVESHAREFPQIQDALRKLGRKKAINPARRNRCPRCHVLLTNSYYEGIPIKLCHRCQGKLIDSSLMIRVITRREFSFSEQLIKKAHEFKEKFILHPTLIKKINPQTGKNIYCPNCGAKMLPRPYSFYYIIPVDKCLYCYKIWFDSDELEILQILIEEV